MAIPNCRHIVYTVVLLTFKVFLGVVSAHPVSTGGRGVADDVTEALDRQRLLQVLLLLFVLLILLHWTFLVLLLHLHREQDEVTEEHYRVKKLISSCLGSSLVIITVWDESYSL